VSLHQFGNATFVREGTVATPADKATGCKAAGIGQAQFSVELLSARASETWKMSKTIVDTAIATAIAQSSSLPIASKCTRREKETTDACFAVVTAGEWSVHHDPGRIRANWFHWNSGGHDNHSRWRQHHLWCIAGLTVHRLIVHRLAVRGLLTVTGLAGGGLAVHGHGLLHGLHLHRGLLHGLSVAVARLGLTLGVQCG